LSPGDLLVVNDSETRPAAVSGTIDGRQIFVHLSAVLDDGTWMVELRRADQLGPEHRGRAGETVDVPDGGLVSLIEPVGNAARLWRVDLALPAPIDEYLRRNGAPIRYPYVSRPWPLSTYTTMFAKPDRARFGSAEMPSAGRLFTRRLTVDLKRRGLNIVALTLHAGVSSLEAHEPPPSERFRVTQSAAQAVNDAKAAGRMVVAVGTSVVRALESVGTPAGRAVPSEGWTDLVLGAERPARLVDGLVTGWHPPEASHLDLLEAVGGRRLVEAMYATALNSRFLWHEFGDAALILPSAGARSGR